MKTAILTIIDIDYFWLMYTIGAFMFFEYLSIRMKRHVFYTPIFWSIFTVLFSLNITSTAFANYMDDVTILQLLLSVTIVSFAIPLYENRSLIIDNWAAITVTLIVTNIASYLPTLLFIEYITPEREIIIAFLGKSATSPINIAITDSLNGNIELAAMFSISTGLVIAFIGKPLLKLLHIFDQPNKGFAIGIAGHGIGCAQVVFDGQLVVGFAALGLILNGILTAFTMPLILTIFY